MGKAIVFENPGGPEVLKVQDIIVGDPQAGEVLVRQTAIGVNPIDLEYRKGQIALEGTPKFCGIEACGIIEKIADGVKHFEVGDRVVYATGPIGAYADYRCVNQKYLIKVPDEIDDQTVASSFAKALTAHYLLYRTFIVREGIAILVHAAHEATGQMICEWANQKGALVIGSVDSDDKIEMAKEHGCHYVINYTSEHWAAEVMKITKKIGVNAVFDSVGQATFVQSLRSLMVAGIMVHYGQSSGPIGAFNIKRLQTKSLFLTCPSLSDYKASRMELILSANEVFERIKSRELTVNIHATYSLEEASKAHQELESGQANGSIILIP